MPEKAARQREDSIFFPTALQHPRHIFCIFAGKIPTMIDQATIDRILNAAQIVDVVSEYVTLRRAGVNYKGLCPFHNEKTPSFVVSPAKGLCKCFSCGKGGNVVHFIMEHEQLSYYDALRFLAKKYHIEIHERELTDEEKQAQSLRESLFIVNQHAATFFQDTLHNTPEGMAVGIATSVSIDHATPASFYAHVKDRGMYHQIGKDLITAGFDFYGGSDFLEPENRELSGEQTLYEQCEKAGYTIARGYADYQQKEEKADKMLLLQTEAASQKDRTSIPYAIDRQKDDLTLRDITRAAIDFLSQKDKDGFFLMVEGGKIDWGCHSNDAATVFQEVIDLDEAVKVAYEFYRQHPEETLILITADHETGGIALGAGSTELHFDLLKNQRQSAEAFSRIIAAQHQSEGDRFTWDFVRQQLKEHFGFWSQIPLDEKETARLKKAYEEFCEGVAKDTRTLYASENVIAGTARKLMARKAMVSWQSNEHSNGYVPVFAIGAGAEKFTGRIDNTEIPRKIAEAAGYDF